VRVETQVRQTRAEAIAVVYPVVSSRSLGQSSAEQNSNNTAGRQADKQAAAVTDADRWESRGVLWARRGTEPL
jgi:hypothetical protein